jgi:hypothetical protein
VKGRRKCEANLQELQIKALGGGPVITFTLQPPSSFTVRIVPIRRMDDLDENLGYSESQEYMMSLASRFCQFGFTERNCQIY